MLWDNMYLYICANAHTDVYCIHICGLKFHIAKMHLK